MGAGSPRPPAPFRRIRAARRVGSPAARAKNPGILLRTSDRANGRPAKGNQRRTKTPHRAASGCGGRERLKRPSQRGPMPRLFRSLRPVPSPTRACGVVWRLRPPLVSLRGAAVRAVACPEKDARVFRPCSRDTGPSRGMAPLFSGPGGRRLPAPIGWGSTRWDSATGVRCRPSTRYDGLLKPPRLHRRARTLGLQRRVSSLEIGVPHAFHGADDLDVSPTGSPGPSSRDTA
jgi:hypothetical protein